MKQTLERVDADREARRPVVGEHPFPDRRLGQVGCRDRRLEGQGELLCLSSGARHARRPRHEPELPEELATS
jgi:hypothetical protein